MFESSWSRKLGLFFGVTLTTALLSASAAEFPLQFKTLKTNEVMSFPGGYGCYGQLSLKKPAGLKAEPKVVSKYPFYGKVRPLGVTDQEQGMLFRIDESQNGKGYDKIIFDFNKNGDLTDDSVVARTQPRSASGIDQALYGPIESSNTVAGAHPIYYAQVYVFYTADNLQQILKQGNLPENLTFGQVRLKPSWYLEATVEFNGTKQKVGIYDCNANERLGDTATSAGDQENRYLWTMGDMLVLDRNNSGKFDSDLLDTEMSPFADTLYLGPTPCKVALLKDCTALSVEPWTEPLAEVALQPYGEQVSWVQLKREVQGKWQPLKALALKGKIQVPPGNYRLETCALLVKTAKGEPLGLEGTLTTARKPFAYAVGANNTLQCGAPLQIQTEASKQSANIYSGSNPPDPKNDSDSILRINSKAVGQGGETYDSYGLGESFRENPKKPTFAITKADGTKILNGNLEFG